MASSRLYDTVAFDVRGNAVMLFFARTSDDGDIDDYVLLMRTVDGEFDESVYVEINEQQFSGRDLIRQVSLTSNLLTLHLKEPAEPLGGVAEVVLTWLDTQENQGSVEAGAFRVFGDLLVGGNA